MTSTKIKSNDAVRELALDGHSLTLAEVEAVARGRMSVSLSPAAQAQIDHSRSIVDHFLEKRTVVYGITTGFGKFKDVFIPPEQTEQLQRNFLASHACGVGPAFDQATTRAITLLRANALAKGFSGIRREVVDLLTALLNSGVHPIIPEQGSVGASGDLAPLAHLALVLTGEGQAVYKGQTMSGRQALEKAGLQPVVLKAKEGLALTNGTQVMAALGCLTVMEAERLAKVADIIGAMSLEAQLGSCKAFSPLIHNVRPHPGQQKSARNLIRLLEESELMESHKDCPMVQDAYSLRCMPQVHGASRQAFQHAREVLEIEINSATDNPLVFEGEVISGGNFHGQPLALIMDYLSIALAELANISERRTERLVNPALSNGLPPFLTNDGGLNSGLMIAQYTAAALVSENKSLAHPASVDSIPTSANQEDHVSMGTIGARKARNILINVRRVLAIELLCAAQGLDLRSGEHDHGEHGQGHEDYVPDSTSVVDLPGSKKGKITNFVPGHKLADTIKAGRGVHAAYHLVREHITHMDQDREIHIDIAAAEDLIASGKLLETVENLLGALE
ncbi:MAG: histidine ammonia-lyase [Cyanobacteria bacterium REEB67]|nr:histidine ammonia-lyase [Cyanobacteria bacterium REEB67]